MKNRITKKSMGLAGAGGVAAIILVSPLIAHADGTGGGTAAPTGTATTSPGPEGSPSGPGAQPKGGGETALTGTTASRVTAAALAAVPGATVLRVTTEHQGASNPYEAHLSKADGSRVTVLIGSAFNVMSVEADPGRGPKGGGETALTGTTASKVTAAALAAVPGATVLRVTTEHQGASNPYEAHLSKADGSRVTVLIGSAFNVMSVEADPGPR